jgi:hypothetical protein
MFNLALNPPFCQTAVIASVFFFVRLLVIRFGRAVGQTHSLPSLGFALAAAAWQCVWL